MSQVVKLLMGSAADFDDFFRPIRAYLYWEPHCYDIPICWSIRSIFFEAIDGISQINDKMKEMLVQFGALDELMPPQLLQQIPQMITIMEGMRDMMLKKMHSTMSGTFGVLDDSNADTGAMGQAFDAAQDDDSFYLPPEVFFQKSGFSAGDERLPVPPTANPRDSSSPTRTTRRPPAGIASISQIRTAAEEALKTTPLQGAKISIAGTAATFKDFSDGSKYDLWIAAVGALCLIFIIMLIITRSLIAALVIVGTVALSLGASFGLSVLLWQYILGIKLHWMVLPMSVIVLLAVGSDYNLLLVSRIKRRIVRGYQHRHHQGHGRHRQGGDQRRPGVRVHHGRDGRQRSADHRSGRYHCRPRPAVRHPGGAVVHDADDRRAARPVVLVATAGSSASGQLHAPVAGNSCVDAGLHAAARGRRTRHGRNPKSDSLVRGLPGARRSPGLQPNIVLQALVGIGGHEPGGLDLRQIQDSAGRARRHRIRRRAEVLRGGHSAHPVRVVAREFEGASRHIGPRGDLPVARHVVRPVGGRAGLEEMPDRPGQLRSERQPAD